MINCIIVDDEPLARQLIETYIDQIPGIESLGSYQTAKEAFEALHNQDIDVIFLDIDMPGINGLNFIRSLKKSPKVVFITAYAEYAVDAFEIEALDYLVKPVTFERFLKAIQKTGITRSEPVQSPDISYIFLKADRKLVKVFFQDIRYIEASGDYLKVHTTARNYVVYMTMGKIESLLPASKFIRVHRSTIVNTLFIQGIENNFIKLDNVEIVIGQTYWENLLKWLK
jgi:two-component system LytT family response regulator